jgi:hypothetical protein
MQVCTLVSCESQQPDAVQAAHVLPESPLPDQRSQVFPEKRSGPISYYDETSPPEAPSVVA